MNVLRRTQRRFRPEAEHLEGRLVLSSGGGAAAAHAAHAADSQQIHEDRNGRGAGAPKDQIGLAPQPDTGTTVITVGSPAAAPIPDTGVQASTLSVGNKIPLTQINGTRPVPDSEHDGFESVGAVGGRSRGGTGAKTRPGLNPNLGNVANANPDNDGISSTTPPTTAALNSTA